MCYTYYIFLLYYSLLFIYEELQCCKHLPFYMNTLINRREILGSLTELITSFLCPLSAVQVPGACLLSGIVAVVVCTYVWFLMMENIRNPI